jgi:hypothetical protein
MFDALGPIYRAESLWYSGAMAGYRGQIGRNAAIPHALPNNIVFEAGDVLVTGATAPVWGYHSELERTMVIGPPSDEQKRMFDHMVALQDLAIDAIRPGVPCAEVDRLVRAYYERVFRTVVGVVRDEHDARDVCQETFLRAFRALPGAAECVSRSTFVRTWKSVHSLRVSLDAMRTVTAGSEHSKRLPVSNDVQCTQAWRSQPQRGQRASSATSADFRTLPQREHRATSWNPGMFGARGSRGPRSRSRGADGGFGASRFSRSRGSS